MQLLDRAAALRIAPIWRLGFRPFFLAGALFAIGAVVLWGASLAGQLPAWQPPGGVLAWHRHEMPFGFGLAIVAGFLLTAVQNWTGRPGLAGRPLAGLFALWCLARLAWFLPLPVALLVGLQLSFVVALVGVLGQAIFRARQKHNYPIPLVLGLIGLSQALCLYGLAVQDVELQRRGVLAALWLIAALMGIIGGRVIPFFTQRGLARSEPFPPKPRQLWLGLACSLLIALGMAGGYGLNAHPALAVPFLVVAGVQLVQLRRWYDHGIWRVPLLWSLHVAFAWLIVAALGMAAWHLGLLAQQSLATHALAVGAMGGLILAMVARVTLGHTGRPLQPPRAMSWAFAALHLGAASRVLLAPIGVYGLWLAIACWCLAFALFVWNYAPMLWRARVDGSPG
ncbi:NnrS protein [compost metagenome]